jgi:hypothetical protein
VELQAVSGPTEGVGEDDVCTRFNIGTVHVRDAVLTRAIDTSGTGVFGLAAGGLGTAADTAETGYPLRFDLRVEAPSTLRIENNTARLVSSAEMTLRGTYEQFNRAYTNIDQPGFHTDFTSQLEYPELRFGTNVAWNYKPTLSFFWNMDFIY